MSAPRSVGAPGDAEASAQSVGRFYTWWRGDPLPALPPIPGLRLGRALDADLVGQVSDLDGDQIAARIRDGSLPYIAAIDGRPVAVGWSARGQVDIGELGIVLDLPAGDRYLWDFQTLPERRGQGIYPRLLQAMLDTESEAAHFWIGHDTDNVASGKGILRAGFGLVGEVWLVSDGLRLAADARADAERAREAARLLQVPLLVEP